MTNIRSVMGAMDPSTRCPSHRDEIQRTAAAGVRRGGVARGVQGQCIDTQDIVPPANLVRRWAAQMQARAAKKARRRFLPGRGPPPVGDPQGPKAPKQSQILERRRNGGEAAFRDPKRRPSVLAQAPKPKATEMVSEAGPRAGELPR